MIINITGGGCGGNSRALTNLLVDKTGPGHNRQKCNCKLQKNQIKIKSKNQKIVISTFACWHLNPVIDIFLSPSLYIYPLFVIDHWSLVIH
ncbi:hypothetical protein DERP_003733 [Dermatophagoides pteronyssinus]|uniref:Uncharacterized protein n=1 Tax=Dermatophagoides pteronyssinus TaxID=6956 RepID=A0ABQ8JLH1_DERPT|nr:hypothetical protein DERP_003733 [Dermatophagoides pteronyssinus]